MGKKEIFLIAAIAALVASGVFYFLSNTEKATPETDKGVAWLVDKGGYLYYSRYRGDINFRRDDYTENSIIKVSKVIFESRGANIYGLLVTPKSASEEMPGVIYLPAAGVKKEERIKLAEAIAGYGAAVMVLDQRGTGETKSTVPDLNADYQRFLQAKEPYQHLLVYDALRAYDLMYSAPFINPEKIAIAGEGLGGRVSIIAASIDKSIKGVVVISSSGFNYQEKGDLSRDAFLKSIDSDHYIGNISPRKIALIHNINDNIISIEQAANSYFKAREPKNMTLINDTACRSSYCDSMLNSVIDSLDYIADIKTRTLISINDNKKVTTMKLASAAFTDNGEIPSEFTCDGSDASPPLSISGVPQNAKSLSLIMDDPDAPGRTFVHWVLWNISPTTKEIKRGGEPGINGKTDFGRFGYGGPCPPSGTHRYLFKLYALDTTLNLSAGSTKRELESAMSGRIIAEAELIGNYKRT